MGLVVHLYLVESNYFLSMWITIFKARFNVEEGLLK